MVGLGYVDFFRGLGFRWDEITDNAFFQLTLLPVGIVNGIIRTHSQSVVLVLGVSCSVGVLGASVCFHVSHSARMGTAIIFQKHFSFLGDA